MEKMANLDLNYFRLGFGFLGLFCFEASQGQHWAHGPKTTLKMLVHVQAGRPSSRQLIAH